MQPESSPVGLFVHQYFTSHSGKKLDWKIDCDALTDDDIATLAYIGSSLCAFGSVIGIPRGGIRLAEALKPYVTSGPVLIVDDVLTTGSSMEKMHMEYPDSRGLVIFSRGTTETWIQAIFSTGA